jgi:dolichol-phosphate mannosyltransferase
MLSVVIPAHNEECCIEDTIRALHHVLVGEQVPHEILVVSDHSDDETEDILKSLAGELPGVRWVPNGGHQGFGYAVRAGLDAFRGDAVCIVMADASDDPKDVVRYYSALEQGYECVFGTRFSRGSVVRDYPRHKLLLNRLANWFIKVLFRLPYNDVTNAFKCYRRSVIEGIQPVLSCHFNITVEMPLKALVRGYSYTVLPIRWYGRAKGVSKLKIKEMGCCSSGCCPAATTGGRTGLRRCE